MTEPVGPETGSEVQRRQDWMRVLACADAGELRDLCTRYDNKPEFNHLRPAECGLMMVQGRMGGTGDPFNAGEITVTRCALRTVDGQVGHAYIAGRDREHAALAALCDAMLQDPARTAAVERTIMIPLRLSERRRKLARSAQVAATKVDFFTLVRGED